MEKVQNKTILSGLIALVVAVCLAIGGIGTALGAPDDDANTQTTTTVDCLAHQFASRYVLPAYGTEAYNNIDDYLIEFLGVDSHEALENDQNHPDSYYHKYLAVLGGGYKFSDGSKVISTDESRWWINEPNGTSGFLSECTDPQPVTVEPTTPVSFTLNFKATGIQSTGFANYKEAFAALNGTN